MSSTLLSPLRVGTLELKNRMAVAPMVTCYCDDGGMPTEQYLAYHETRARGGREPVDLPMAGTDPRLVPAGSPRH